MNFTNEITELETKVSSLNSSLNSLKGKCSLLSDQIKTGENKIEKLEYNREVYRKSVELLNLVQITTVKKIKGGFEQLGTYALRYVFSGDYKFLLEFDRRGNLPVLDFKVSTPTCKKPFNPIDSDAGGVMDILSLALRVALLELSKPKIEGFLLLDEPFRNINGEDYLQNSLKFIKEINKKINRQIILTTNKTTTFETADNAIEIKKEE